MTGMRAYYVSRVVVAVAFAAMFALLGAAWWQAALVGVAAIAWFLWAPHSGRYAVRPDLGPTALRRDERSEVVNARAASIGFVGVMLGVMALSLYHHALGVEMMPVRVLSYVLIGGVILYCTGDFVLRRRG
jgi:fatty acid desaturase